jgi:guanylate kinase
MSDSKQKALLIVVSAPSGAGKTTLCDRLLRELNSITYSVSCTTRPPRGSEKNGEHYEFMSRDAFRELIERAAFLEHAEVHGHFYGTLQKPVDDALRQGISVLMDIDVQGGRLIRDRVMTLPDGSPMKKGFIDVFIEPPSLEDLRHRLADRGENAEEDMATRLRNAQTEMDHSHEYQYRVINRHLDEALSELKSIILREMGKDDKCDDPLELDASGGT